MSGGPYEVVSVLPVDERDSPTYRVKSKAEPFARAAKESDLVAGRLAVEQTTSARAVGGSFASTARAVPIAVTSVSFIRSRLNTACSAQTYLPPS